MKRKIYISLKVKLTIVVTLLIALISLFVYYYFSMKFEQERLLSLQEKANSVAKIAAYEISSVLNYHDGEASQEKIDQLIQDEEISYVVVFRDDSLYYEYNTFIAVLNDYKNVGENSVSTKWEVMKSHAPITVYDEKIGDIYVGYSLASVYQKIDDLKITIGIVSLIIFFIGAFAVFFIISGFTKPLRKIVKVADKINDGDLSQRVKISSKDDVGLISSSFNEMAEKVSSANKEMDLINKEFETRVRTRTQDLESALRKLQNENKQRKNIELEISKSLHEKEVLLKEIHHRVKNNLQIVSSLFFFQSKNITDQVTLDMFRDGQNRVKSMALIHEKLYQSGDLANIDFKEYIKKLANFLFQSYGIQQNRIKLRNHVQDVKLGVDAAVPCGLIINELISNSFKHGFSQTDTGEIKIDMGYDENDKLVLKISDNGKGLPADLNIEESDSLGLRLVNNLTTQLNGKVTFLNSNGTTVRIVFPNPNAKKAT